MVLFRITMHDSLKTIICDYAIGYGVWFILFFSSSFIAISLLQEEKYCFYEFILDVIEVISAFSVFFFLGLFDTNTIHTPNFRGIYSSIFCITFIQFLWRYHIIDSFSDILMILRGILLLLATLGAVWFYKFNVFNFINLVAMFFLLYKYFIIIKLMSRKN